MNVSPDGFVERPDGRFGWSQPDEVVHRFHNQIAENLGVFLYGRRMYETMAGCQNVVEGPSVPDYILNFVRIWSAKSKVVFPPTLERVGENCRPVRGDPAAEIARLKGQPGGDLGVTGPGLASTLARLGLIDEYRLVVFPGLGGPWQAILPGDGTPDSPASSRDSDIRLRRSAPPLSTGLRWRAQPHRGLMTGRQLMLGGEVV